MRQLNSFFILVMFTTIMVGQSSIDKSIDASGLKEVTIILNNTFQIEISNNLEDKIIFSVQSEGEYQDRILINTQRLETSVVLQDDVQPFSESHNDKLSAHKVFAVKVKIQIPPYLKVVVQSRTASLNITGKLKHLFAELNSGDCLLKSYIGEAMINTFTGNIDIYTKDASINASTRSGEIKGKMTFGRYPIELKSISGNINIHNMK
ncbi:hypothetical protein U0D62_06455 [Aquimarina sp. 2201CG5-10]|nr:hypothetical protein [Aquimarina sp. 2201CG5-10]